MNKIVTDKKFYVAVLAMAIPVAFQNLITFGVAFADNLMVGALGERSLAGVATANYMTFLFTVTCFGIGSGAVVLISQYFGKGNIEAIQKVMAIAIRIALAIASVFALVGVFAPEFCLSIFTNDQEIIELGQVYLRIVAISYLFSAFTTVFLISVRGVEQVIISSVVYILSFIISVSLNYILIFGMFGFPALGIKGAAIGTLCARIFEFTLVTVYAYFIEKKIKFRYRFLLHWDADLTLDYFRYGMPVLLNELLWATGISLQNMIIGRMGRDVVAANSITGNIDQLSSIMIFGVANASAVIIGKAIGSGDKPYAIKCANTFAAFSLFLGLVSSTFVFLIRHRIVGFFNVSPETQLLASQTMLSLSIILFFVSISAVHIVGTFRGGGDTKFGMYADLILVWFVSTPLGYVAGLVWGLPLPIVLLCLKVDEMIKACLCLWRVFGNKWIKTVVREAPVIQEAI